MEFFATSNGIPVHISDTEKGDITILLLHGYLETLYVWEEFIGLFPKNFRFISIDLPGHGLTGTHPHSNSMEFCADTIKAYKPCFLLLFLPAFSLEHLYRFLYLKLLLDLV